MTRWRVSLTIRVQTTLSHVRFVRFNVWMALPHRMILIVSSGSCSFSLLISSFSNPTFSLLHSTSLVSDVVSLSYFSCSLYRSYCSDCSCMFFWANSMRVASIFSSASLRFSALSIISAVWNTQQIERVSSTVYFKNNNLSNGAVSRVTYVVLISLNLAINYTNYPKHYQRKTVL